MNLKEKEFTMLKEWIIENTKGKALVALSGGVDSAVVALAVKEAIGKENTIAITANYNTLSQEEINDAKKITKVLDIRHEIIEYNELEDKDFRKNDHQRCYYCRKELGKYLSEYAKHNHIENIFDGTNIEDLNEYRPGIKALKEYGIKSPLFESRLNKNNIRKIARNFNLFVHDKPSNSCLASRVPFGDEITFEKLRKIEQSELIIKKIFNLRQVRVRDHEEIARLEIDKSEFSKIFDVKKIENANEELRKIGFRFVTLDLGGYKSGNLITLR